MVWTLAWLKNLVYMYKFKNHLPSRYKKKSYFERWWSDIKIEVVSNSRYFNMSGYNYTSDNGNQNLLSQPPYENPIPANLFILLIVWGILGIICLVNLVFKILENKFQTTSSIEPIQNVVTIHRRIRSDFFYETDRFRFWMLIEADWVHFWHFQKIPVRFWILVRNGTIPRNMNGSSSFCKGPRTSKV